MQYNFKFRCEAIGGPIATCCSQFKVEVPDNVIPSVRIPMWLIQQAEKAARVAFEQKMQDLLEPPYGN